LHWWFRIVGVDQWSSISKQNKEVNGSLNCDPFLF
jgi:hypothetical protein